MIRKVIAVLGGALLLTLVWALPIVAQRQIDAPAAPLAPDATPAQIAFTLRSGTTAWLDNNKSCAPDYVGPHAMWIVVGITNHATEPLTNAVATLSGFTSANFTITADPIRYIGILAPSSTYYGYWYVSYACTAGHTAAYTVTLAADNLDGNAYYNSSLTTATTIDKANEAKVVSSSKGAATQDGYTRRCGINWQAVMPRAFPAPGDATSTTAASADCAGSQFHQQWDQHRNRINLSLPAVSAPMVDMVYDWQALCRAEAPRRLGGGAVRQILNNYGVRFRPSPPVYRWTCRYPHATLVTSASTITLPCA